jgi:hypothetical protein
VGAALATHRGSDFLEQERNGDKSGYGVPNAFDK